MRRQGVLYLISEQEAHGAFERPQQTLRKVFCEIRSVGYQEYYRAMERDLNPSLVFRLADYAEYKGERKAIFEDVHYRVVRVYVDGNAIELTVEEAVTDG